MFYFFLQCRFFFSKGGLKSLLKFNGMAPFLYLQVILIILMNVFRGLSLTCHSAEYRIGSECCPKCLSGKNQLNDECMCFLSTQLRHNKKKEKASLKLICCFFSSGSRVKTHCNEYRSTSCLPCMDGTFTDQPNGLERCIPCTNCDSGELISLGFTMFYVIVFQIKTLR